MESDLEHDDHIAEDHEDGRRGKEISRLVGKVGFLDLGLDRQLELEEEKSEGSEPCSEVSLSVEELSSVMCGPNEKLVTCGREQCEHGPGSVDACQL